MFLTVNLGGPIEAFCICKYGNEHGVHDWHGRIRRGTLISFRKFCDLPVDRHLSSGLQEDWITTRASMDAKRYLKAEEEDALMW